MQNRRKLNRVETDNTMRVYDITSGEFLGCLGNIHPEGMMLISNRPLVEGAVLRLSIHLSKTIAGTKELEVDAKCVWSKEDIHCSSSGSGLAFIRPSQVITEVISAMVDDAAFKCSDEELSVVEFSEST